MTTEIAEKEYGCTPTETALEGPAVDWDRRIMKTNRSPMNPTIAQGNRYVAVRRKWASCCSSGSARQRQ